MRVQNFCYFTIPVMCGAVGFLSCSKNSEKVVRDTPTLSQASENPIPNTPVPLAPDGAGPSLQRPKAERSMPAQAGWTEKQRALCENVNAYSTDYLFNDLYAQYDCQSTDLLLNPLENLLPSSSHFSTEFWNEGELKKCTNVSVADVTFVVYFAQKKRCNKEFKADTKLQITYNSCYESISKIVNETQQFGYVEIVNLEQNLRQFSVVNWKSVESKKSFYKKVQQMLPLLTNVESNAICSLALEDLLSDKFPRVLE